MKSTWSYELALFLEEIESLQVGKYILGLDKLQTFERSEQQQVQLG